MKGKTDVFLCINDMEFSTNVVVAQLGDLSGILGLDFLSKYEAIMEMNAGRIHLPFFGAIGLVKEDKLQSKCARIHMTETVSIPAKCEMVVKGSTDCAIPHGVEGLLEPLANGKGILLPKSVVEVRDSKVLFSVLNPTAEKVTFKKNATVASVQTIESVTEFSSRKITESRPMGTTLQSLPDYLQPLVNNSSSNLT